MPIKTFFNIRKNHKVRLAAFDLLKKLKSENVSRQKIVNKIHDKFGIPIGTAYDWYKGKVLPYGRRGGIIQQPELFYVIGALLGDGCVYSWKITHNHVILVGDKNFTTKYARMLAPCIGKKVKPYINRSKNIWFVSSNNFELHSIFKMVREDLAYLENLMEQNNDRSKVLFIEGFFDAEGCVKIIKEKTRKTPKICLDITNNNHEFLELIRKLLKEQLDIESRYSVQKYNDGKRKTTYHLRIYKKEYVKRFFENISTTKLKKEKVAYLQNWLNLN
jgi:hypothetical protein